MINLFFLCLLFVTTSHATEVCDVLLESARSGSPISSYDQEDDSVSIYRKSRGQSWCSLEGLGGFFSGLPSVIGLGSPKKRIVTIACPVEKEKHNSSSRRPRFCTKLILGAVVFGFSTRPVQAENWAHLYRNVLLYPRHNNTEKLHNVLVGAT